VSTKVELRTVVLTEVVLQKLVLTKAVLAKAFLTDVVLTDVVLTKVVLTKVVLTKVVFNIINILLPYVTALRHINPEAKLVEKLFLGVYYCNVSYIFCEQ